MLRENSFSIPDFCKNSSVLMLILLTELLAIVVTLIKYGSAFFQHLGPISLYFQWCTLLSCGLLCLSREHLNKWKGYRAVIGAFGCCFIPFLGIEIGSQMVLNDYLEEFDASQLITRAVAVILLVLLTLRLFSLMSLLELRSKAEMSQRILALQSRIKPHFLFNSLNTISELIHVDARKAEDAINSLSLLFRASLENDRRFHSLESEINLCQRYIDLERWRLSDKLRVVWKGDVANAEKIETPKLTMQPLIENAIVHGVKADGTIDIEVDIRSTKSHLSLMITNVKGSSPDVLSGHGIAIENIKERLFVLYDDQQTFRVKESADSYCVLVRFPKNKITAGRS